MHSIIRNICLIPALLLVACASRPPLAEPPPSVENQRVAALAQAISRLGDGVDAHEARRAASLSFSYSRRLAREYEITDSPLMHNLKVNLGLRSRGLCVHWTRDLLLRLREEKFATLDLHWAIANYEKTFSIEHSTVIISASGAGLDDGIVLDPWRNGGQLFWSPTREDSAYFWRPRAEIMALKKELEKASDER